MQTTHRKKVKRVLNIISLNDDNVFHYPDEGPAKDGANTVTRGQLQSLLDKTEVVGGKVMPVFLLADTPDTSVFGPEHEWDRKNLKDKKGEWHLPYPEWLAERDRRIDRTKERKARSRRAQENKAAVRVVKNLAKMTGDEEPAETPKVAKPTTHGAEKPAEKPAEKKGGHP